MLFYFGGSMSNLKIIFILIFVFCKANFGQDHPRVLLETADIPTISARIANHQDDYLGLLYNQMTAYADQFAYDTHPGSDIDTYGKYAQVAFVALLEDNDIWKDNMINLAILFDTNFSKVIDDEFNMIGAMEAYGHNVSFYTLASALIYDFCFDRMDATEKSILISNILYGLNILHVDIKNDGIYYKYNAGHFIMDAAYIIGAIAIADDTPNYTLDSLNNDLNLIKTNLFDPDYGLMKYMFGDEGSYLEGNAYFGINFGRMFLALQALSKHEGIDYFHIPVVENSFSKVSKWLLSHLLPNRIPYSFTWNGLNDSWNTISNTYVNLLVIAQKYNDGKARWLFDEIFGGDPSHIYIATNGYRASDPEVFIPSILIFEDYPEEAPDINEYNTYLDYKRGLLTWQTGWDMEDLLFSIESTPAHHIDPGVLPIRHLQCDKGNITLTAYGTNFIYDPNCGNNLVHNKTDANNYINVDIKGEATLIGDEGRYMNSGKLRDFEDFNLYSTISAKTSTAFDTLFYRDKTEVRIYDEFTGDPTGGFVNQVEKAERTIFYLKQSVTTPYYFWVIDEIQKNASTPAEYDWHLITRFSNMIDNSGNPVKIYNPANDDNLDIKIILPESGSYSFSFSTINDINGYGGGKKISIIHNAVQGHFNVLLVPTTTGLPSKTYSDLSMINGSGVKVDWDNGYDDYLLYSNDNSIEHAASFSNANHVFIRENNSNDVYEQYFMRNGSSLIFNGTHLVNLYGNQGTVVCDNDIVNIVGNNVSKAKIYAPYAAQLFINDIETPFNRFNDYIRIGNIGENETWTGNIEMNTDQVIEEEVTVNIYEGTSIKFSSDIKLIVNGTLDAQGTCSDLIDFTSASANPAPQDWYGIFVDGSNASVDMDYCSIKYANRGVKFNDDAEGSISNSTIRYNKYGMYIYLSEPIIQNCTITNNESGIRMYYSYTQNWNDIHIENSDISQNSIVGIYMHNSSPSISASELDANKWGLQIRGNSNSIFFDNDITNSSYYGVLSADQASPDFWFNPGYEFGGYNTIEGNGDRGVIISGSSLPNFGTEPDVGGYNSFLDNTGYEMDNNTSYTVMARENWWGSASGPGSDIDGSIAWSPALSSAPGEPKSKSGGGPLASKENIVLPSDLQLAFKNQMNGNYEIAAALFKNHFINEKGSPFRILATNQFLKTLGYFMDAITASDEIQLAINKVRNQEVLFELLLGQSSKLIKSRNSAVALNKLNQTFGFNIPQGKKNQVLFQKAYLYANHLNDLDKARECLLEILANNDPGSDDYLLAEEELELINYNNSKTLGKELVNVKSEIPGTYQLLPNYPNPFNPSTTISYAIPKQSELEIVIYDALGKKIKTLLTGNTDAGSHQTIWDGTNQSGKQVSSGVYFYTFKAKALDESNEIFLKSAKLLLLK